jgi:hypothetical protein
MDVEIHGGHNGLIDPDFPCRGVRLPMGQFRVPVPRPHVPFSHSTGGTDAEERHQRSVSPRVRKMRQGIEWQTGPPRAEFAELWVIDGGRVETTIDGHCEYLQCDVAGTSGDPMSRP